MTAENWACLGLASKGVDSNLLDRIIRSDQFTSRRRPTVSSVHPIWT